MSTTIQKEKTPTRSEPNKTDHYPTSNDSENLPSLDEEGWYHNDHGNGD